MFLYRFNISYTDAHKFFSMAFACTASSCASDQDKAAVSDLYYINIFYYPFSVWDFCEGERTFLLPDSFF